ncbi:uncharacterized protein TNCT_724391 [Trichonephila clavata]|uniref:Uncharacterized protein n=1 Tax=Trichonephila clavata TaxID=2740835 RepID=A0A8X6LGZ3_TRICU|nr:uncharacterized protein TNCT_724391 [Trichonephila clavata]
MQSRNAEIVYSLKRNFQEQSNGTNKTPYDRVKQCWEHKRMKVAKRINVGISTSAAGAVEVMRMDDEIASILTPDCVGIEFLRLSFMKTHRAGAIARFTTKFVNNPFGHKVDRLYGFSAHISQQKKNTYRC